jgi:hypothetical protein
MADEIEPSSVSNEVTSIAVESDQPSHGQMLNEAWNELSGIVRRGFKAEEYVPAQERHIRRILQYWNANLLKCLEGLGFTSVTPLRDIFGKRITLEDEHYVFNAGGSSSASIEINRRSREGRDHVSMFSSTTEVGSLKPMILIRSGIGTILPKTANIYPVSYFLNINDGRITQFQRKHDYFDPQTESRAYLEEFLGVSLAETTPRLPSAGLTSTKPA